MDIEIISFLMKYMNWFYGAVIIGITEIIKLLSVRQDDKKYVLRFDTNCYYPFNIRIPILIISFFIGIGIIIIDEQAEIFNLFATFCITNTAYDYIFKIAKNKLKEK